MFSEWKVTRVAIDAVSKLLALQLRGDGPDGDDEAAIPEDDAQFLGQFGVAIRPVVAATLEALGYQDGDEVRVLKLWDKARSPTDLAAGETRLYAVGDLNVRVRLRADSLSLEARGATITITSSGAVQVTPAAGQDVVLNGGSLGVARVSDPVTPNATLVAAVNAMVAAFNAPGGPGLPVLTPGSALTPFSGPAGTITSGAAHVKA